MQENNQRPDIVGQANRVILVLALICVGLLLAVSYLILKRQDDQPLATALSDPQLRQEVISQLVAESTNIYDSHSDADVGRVLLPNLRDRKLRDLEISTNAFGMRDRDYVLPKPADVTRIVILGDSFVFGYGVVANDRMGAYLETFLEQKMRNFKGRIECLHFGIPSWNIQAETAYLRRQLSDLQPDLVFQIVVPNDVDDSAGTRGFGGAANFSTQHRQRADMRITAGFPSRGLGIKAIGLLRLGLDYESQTRYLDAADDLAELADAVTETGAHYRLLVHYRHLLPVAWKRLAHRLAPEQVIYLSRVLGHDQYRIADNDPHWNPEGHTLVAKLMYGLISDENLLPQLNLVAWPEASGVLEEISSEGKRLAARELDVAGTLAIFRSPKVSTTLDFTAIDSATAAQVNGGIDRQGRLSPYASFLLRNDDGKELRIEGHTLPRPELDGARVRIFVDAEQVGEIELQADREIDVTYTLPPEVADRPFLSIRIESDDYIYTGNDLQHCVVFELKKLSILA